MSRTTASPGAGPTPTPSRPAAAAVLLAFAMTVSTIPVPSLGVLATFLIDDLGLSRTQLGTLIAAVSIVTAACSPLAGRVADSLGGRRSLLALFALSSGVVVAMALAPSYGALLGVAVVAGLLNAIGNPGTNRYIAEMVPAGRRGVAVGVKQSGVQAGIFLLGVILPPLAVRLGWRGALLAIAFTPLLALVVAFRWLERAPVPIRAAPPPATAEPVGALPWLVGYALFMGAGTASINSFLPLYGEEAMGLPVAVAGLPLALVGGLGVVSRIGWGAVGERVRDVTVPLGGIAAGAIAVAFLLASSQARGTWALWTAAVLAGFTTSSWNAVAMLAALTRTGSMGAGRAAGWVMVGFMGGFAIGPLLFAATVERSGYRSAWLVAAAEFLAALGVTLLWRALGRRSSRWGPLSG